MVASASAAISSISPTAAVARWVSEGSITMRERLRDEGWWRSLDGMDNEGMKQGRE